MQCHREKVLLWPQHMVFKTAKICSGYCTKQKLAISVNWFSIYNPFQKTSFGNSHRKLSNATQRNLRNAAQLSDAHQLTNSSQVISGQHYSSAQQSRSATQLSNAAQQRSLATQLSNAAQQRKVKISSLRKWYQEVDSSFVRQSKNWPQRWNELVLLIF